MSSRKSAGPVAPEENPSTTAPVYSEGAGEGEALDLEERRKLKLKPIKIIESPGNPDYLLPGLRCLGYKVVAEKAQCWDEPKVARQVLKGGIWVYAPHNGGCSRGEIYKVEAPVKKVEQVKEALDMSMALLEYVWPGRYDEKLYWYMLKVANETMKKIANGEVDVSEIKADWNNPAWHENPEESLVAQMALTPIIIPIHVDGKIVVNALKQLGYKVRNVEGKCANDPEVARRMARGGIWLFKVDELFCGRQGSLAEVFEVDLPREKAGKVKEEAGDSLLKAQDIIEAEVKQAVAAIERAWQYFSSWHHIKADEYDFVYVVKKWGEVLRAYERGEKVGVDKVKECMWERDLEYEF